MSHFDNFDMSIYKAFDIILKASLQPLFWRKTKVLLLSIFKRCPQVYLLFVVTVNFTNKYKIGFRKKVFCIHWCYCIKIPMNTVQKRSINRRLLMTCGHDLLNNFGNEFHDFFVIENRGRGWMFFGAKWF